MPEVTCEIDFNEYQEFDPEIEACPECGDALKCSTDIDTDVHMIFVTFTCSGCGYTQTER